MISASCTKWRFHLRDYPQSLWDMTELEVWGRLIGAEQKATKRGKCQDKQTFIFLLKI